MPIDPTFQELLVTLPIAEHRRSRVRAGARRPGRTRSIAEQAGAGWRRWTTGCPGAPLQPPSRTLGPHLRWVAEHAAELGGDFDRLAVAGDSASVVGQVGYSLSDIVDEHRQVAPGAHGPPSAWSPPLPGRRARWRAGRHAPEFRLHLALGATVVHAGIRSGPDVPVSRAELVAADVFRRTVSSTPCRSCDSLGTGRSG